MLLAAKSLLMNYLVNLFVMVLTLKVFHLLLGKKTGNKTCRFVSSEGCTGSDQKDSGSRSRNVYRCPTDGSAHHCNRRPLG